MLCICSILLLRVGLKPLICLFWVEVFSSSSFKWTFHLLPISPVWYAWGREKLIVAQVLGLAFIFVIATKVHFSCAKSAIVICLPYIYSILVTGEPLFLFHGSGNMVSEWVLLGEVIGWKQLNAHRSPSYVTAGAWEGAMVQQLPHHQRNIRLEPYTWSIWS